MGRIGGVGMRSGQVPRIGQAKQRVEMTTRVGRKPNGVGLPPLRTSGKGIKTPTPGKEWGRIRSPPKPMVNGRLRRRNGLQTRRGGRLLLKKKGSLRLKKVLTPPLR